MEHEKQHLSRRKTGESKIASTYRLQLTPQFTLRDAAGLVDYLNALGVTTLYVSPIFEARQGSAHGYDVTDASSIRREFCGPEGVTGLSKALHRAGMSWLQGIVPNHTAFDGGNRILRDVLVNGMSSQHRDYFDIDWDHCSPALRGKLLAPFLGTDYTPALEAHELKIVTDGGIAVDYHGFRLPLSAETHRVFLDRITDPSGAGKESPQPGASSPAGADADEAMEKFRKLLSDDEFRRRIRHFLAGINSDARKIDEVLSRQHFLLRWHGSAATEINYRRFFAVNDLIAVRVEEPEVFSESHALLGMLLRKGILDGVRVDHIDGLSHPAEYLSRLKKLTDGRYTVVEKILSDGEHLDGRWPVHGSTGYDFMDWSGRLFVVRESASSLESTYRAFTGYTGVPARDIIQTKRETVRKLFAGDVANLSLLMLRAISGRPYGRGVTARGMEEAVIELLAHMPVYRTYFSPDTYGRKDVRTLGTAIRDASADAPRLKHELDAVRSMLRDAASDRSAMSAVMRLQQLMPAAMAKSFEDTFFFNYNVLVSLNEVGSSPLYTGISAAEFHDRIRERFRRHPYSMNSTSTHDTKMGEDMRCRISVISEMPETWEKNVMRWSGLNSKFRRHCSSGICPSPDDEYYIYQVMLGSRPQDGGREEWLSRLKEHMVKHMREGGRRTTWEKPDSEYEEGCVQFIKNVLSPGNAQFLRSFDRMQSAVSFHGFLNSMSMVTLRIMCPGVPDTYQGSECWNFSFVDPDNRRPVDFDSLRRRLGDTDVMENSRENAARLVGSFADGTVKMHVTRLLLMLRRQESGLFLDGDYIPLKAAGKRRDGVVSFARRLGKQSVIVIAPIRTVGLTQQGRGRLWHRSWEDTYVTLPEDFPRGHRDIFTGRKPEVREGRHGGRLMIGDALVEFPVSVMVSGIDFGTGA